MEGDELKKIMDALNSAGFDVKRIEAETKIMEPDQFTGALIIRVLKKEKAA